MTLYYILKYMNLKIKMNKYKQCEATAINQIAKPTNKIKQN